MTSADSDRATADGANPDGASSDRADPYRLPTTVRPRRYALTIAPNIDAATFIGTVAITVDVLETTRTIVCNAADLAIHAATVQPAGSPPLDAKASLDAELQRLTLDLPAAIPTGEATVTISFAGTLNDELRGFYRSTWTDGDGVAHTLGSTQFEATDARRAFPCWDEPSAKAVFELELLVPDGLVGLANSAVLEERPTDGGTWVRFAPTMVMSTYLVAWVVGELDLTDPMDVDGIAFRVACVPGRGHLAPFALEVAAHSLRYFATYFGIAYPGDKLDLIAIPDFAFGAMENLGCVTFRDTALLVDPDQASRVEFERIADTVAHEIAHMWFGDLVTMKWWNGIWLNEAFATLMEMKCVDAFRPDWQRWVTHSTSRAAAMSIDALSTTRPVEYPVVSPDDAEGMFDVLTYQKGGSVLRMLECYLGEEAFQRGIQRYLDEHRYANTETTDLWDALEAATGEPVRAVMDSWIFQGGFPEITVGLTPEGVSLTQRQFTFAPAAPREDERQWGVPIVLRTGGTTMRTLLRDRSTTVQTSGSTVVNDGGWGFFSTRYEPDALAAVARGFSALLPSERFNLVYETWLSVMAGRTAPAEWLSLAAALGDESDPDVWTAVVGPLDVLDRVVRVASPDSEGAAGIVRELCRPALDRLGWKAARREDQRTGAARAIVIRALGTIGDDRDTRDRSLKLYRKWQAKPATLDAELASAVIAIVAGAGGAAEYDEFWEHVRTATTPQETIRYLYALGDFSDAALITRTLEAALSEVRPHDGPVVVSRTLANRWHGPLAWDWLTEHWDAAVERFPRLMAARMIGGVAANVDPAHAERICDFLAAHPILPAQQQVDQLVERVRVNAAMCARERDGIVALLGRHRA